MRLVEWTGRLFKWRMALNFKDDETDRLAREVASLTGETLTVAVRRVLAERLERERLRRGEPQGLADRILAIGQHCASLRTLISVRRMKS